MIVEQRKYLRWIWFAEKPGWHPRHVYLQTGTRVFRWTHVRRPFSTMIIDLTQHEEVIRGHYSKKGAYEIRRAEKDNLTYGIAEDRETFVALFNVTARVKKLQGLTLEKLLAKPESVLTRIAKDGETLAMHFYLVDREQGVALLLYAASAHRRYADAGRRSLAGRAHRLLFHRDFLYFKQQGYRRYDFGGYHPQKEDADLRGVSRFKRDFGGQALEQWNYYPLLYFLFRKGRSWISSWRRHGRA